MKELSIEEKACRYDEAIKKANELNYVSDKDSLQRKTVEHIFPELRESEEERIRKGLIGYFQAGKCEKISSYHGISTNDILAWLEKQDKKNLVKHFCDCVHVGCHVNDCKRWCHSYQKEISYTDCNSNCNRYSKPMNHAFNIGEIITDGISTFKIVDIKDNYYIADDGERVEIYMAHRYYTIIQNLGLLISEPQAIGTLKIIEQRYPWSEEDEKRISSILLSIEYCKEQYPNLREYQYDIDWLKSLKDRVQPQSEWGEEDGDIRDNIIRDLKRLSGDMVSPNQTYQKEIQWLKSLRPQSQWKPSEKQMKALHDLNLTGGISYAGQGQVLINLYNELKKLK